MATSTEKGYNEYMRAYMRDYRRKNPDKVLQWKLNELVRMSEKLREQREKEKINDAETSKSLSNLHSQNEIDTHQG